MVDTATSVDGLGLYTVTPENIEGINLMVYGYQGVGKTVLAATAQDHEEMKDVLFLNIEGGLMSVAHRKDIKAVNVKSTQQVEDIYWMLKKGDERLSTVRTVVIDSITELQTMNLEEISQARPNKKDMHTREDYMKSTTMLKRLFRMYKDLPINVIYNALPKEITPDGSESPTAVIPSLTKSLAESTMGFMDLIWYMYSIDEVAEKENSEGKMEKYKTGNKVRKLLTQQAGVYRGKTRGVDFSAAIGNPIDDPTLPEIYDVWKNSSE